MGFIGSHLAVGLVNGGSTVFGVDQHNNPANKELQALIKKRKIKTFVGNCASMSTAKLPKVDVVYHLAGKVAAWGRQEDFDTVNLGCTQNVLDYAKRVGARRIVLISSAAVYGFYGYTNLTEEAEKKPFCNPYPLSKLKTEQLVTDYCKQNNLSYVIIRPGNVYGPYDYTSYPIYKKVAAGRMPVVDKGRHLSCFVYVRNLVDAIVKAGANAYAGNTDYNISDGYNETLRDYLCCVAKHMGAKEKFFNVPAPMAVMAANCVEGTYKLLKIKKPPLVTRFTVYQNINDYHFSIDKAKRVLEYRPKYSMDEGVRETCEWFKKETQK